MNIVHITYFYWPIAGGQEIYIETLNSILTRAGHNVSVFQPWRPGVESAPHVTAMPPCPRLERLLDHWSLWGWGWHLFNLQLFARRALLKRADIIISHYAVHTPPVWDMTRKVLVVSHGVEWDSEKQTLESRLRRQIGRWALARFATVANDTNYFRTLGLRAAAGTVEPFSQVTTRRWYVPNCVDTNFFRKVSPLPELLGRTVVLVPRIITRDRGIELAIRAFSLLAGEERNLWLYIAGGPSTGRHVEFCRNLVNHLGLDSRVCFLGQVERGRMPALYSSAAVTLIPSLRREGTSLSALESMACGTPVVSTAVGGLQDLPTLKAYPTPESITERIREVLAARDEIATQQAAAVRKSFNLEIWRKTWLKILARMADGTD
ncbi:MAG: glycosyltransferase family 4 protein [Kiritimatiellia bacterium]